MSAAMPAVKCEESARALSAAEILGASDVRVEPVAVPEWGGRVYVRSMTGTARDRYDELRSGDGGQPKLANFRARLVVFTCCDEKGNLLFSEEQIPVLAAKSSLPITALFRAAAKLNKLGEEAEAAEKKDSAEAPSAGSPTASA